MEVILGLLTLGLSVYLSVTKLAFFRGRQSVKQEIDDENSKILSTLNNEVSGLIKDVKYVIESHKSLSNRVTSMEKGVILQDAKLVQLEKFFENILSQNAELQKHIVENSKAVHSLNTSVGAVRELLDNLIKGNLIINNNG